MTSTVATASEISSNDRGAPWPVVKLGQVLFLDLDKVHVDPAETYPMVGVYSFGRGFFEREPVQGGRTSYKVFYKLRSDHIVMSQLFGWEGALALSSDKFAGKFVSPQFPTFFADEKKLDRQYLGWYMRRSKFWEELGARTRGMGDRRRTLNPDALLTCEIPLPPLSEQRHIVRKIEQLAAKIQEARGLRHKADIDTVGLDARMAEVSFVTPHSKGIASVPIEEASERITVGHVSSMRHAYREEGIPFLRSQNVRKNRFNTLGLCRISPEFHKANPKSALRPGSVVVVRTGYFLGTACVVPDDLVEANCADLVIIETAKGLDPHYLSYFLNSQSGKQRANSASVGSAQRHYNVSALRRTRIPLPPISEQRRIVEYLDGLQEKVEHLRALQAQTAVELDALLPSILDKAFRGQL